jgi:hypothetical protein
VSKNAIAQVINKYQGDKKKKREAGTIKIISYINNVRDLDLIDVWDLVQEATKPGNKIIMLDESDIEEEAFHGVSQNDGVIVVYKGSGSTADVSQALTKEFT